MFTKYLFLIQYSPQPSTQVARGLGTTDLRCHRIGVLKTVTLCSYGLQFSKLRVILGTNARLWTFDQTCKVTDYFKNTKKENALVRVNC